MNCYKGGGGWSSSDVAREQLQCRPESPSKAQAQPQPAVKWAADSPAGTLVGVQSKSGGKRRAAGGIDSSRWMYQGGGLFRALVHQM